MEQTWFDLPVESRLTEVWPRGLLKTSKMVPARCKAAGNMSVPMPYWNLPVVPMDQKMPLLPGPKDLYHLSRSKLGKKLWACEDSEFSLNEFIKKEIFNAYEILHDPNLAHYLRRPKIVRRLKELGLVDSDLGVMCNLKDFNVYRRYLAFVHTNAINKLYKELFKRGDRSLIITNLVTSLENQNAKQRITEEIEKRHEEVFKILAAEKAKKDSVCARRLRRVTDVFKKKKSDEEAKRIAARESAKEFTKKIQQNQYYANAQLRQHKLDTMRKWRMQNTEKAALFEQRKKKLQQDLIDKKTEWFNNKIKHQEKRVLQETQINVLMDHEFSPEYKRYLKYIKKENYKNPPEQSVEQEYGVSSESDIEESDLLNQLRLFTKAGYQLQRGSFISRAQAKQSVAKLASTAGRGSMAIVRRMSEKFLKDRQNLKMKKKNSVLTALINSDILKLLSPSLQDIFKKSSHKWKHPKKVEQKQQETPVEDAQQDKSSPTPPNMEPQTQATQPKSTFPTNKNHQVNRSVNNPVDRNTSKEETSENDIQVNVGFSNNSEIEIKPPNKTIPPPPICHMNVYRYFDRLLGKVILEYVTRILLPKFPEIINRCHWVSKAEGLPEDSPANTEKPLCHPEDSKESYTECMDEMKELCDKKIAAYMLLLSESPDIRLFRHKFNGIGEIACPESLVGNFLVQATPHPQHILDYIHWRADWILNYPPPKTYQEIYDLKYVIGVMKNIECPVFEPIYKLWEITNDINLNPEVLEKFILYMEKKKEHKPMVALNPIKIAVKNVKKAMEPLIMDYKAHAAIDDYCFRDYLKYPSELFQMTYLKRPIDPKIWKILDELLDKNKNKEEIECLRCTPDKIREKLSLEGEFENLKLTAPECLFVDPQDYAEELKKAKEKAKADAEPPQRLTFGITEFIPFIEEELFEGEKGTSDEPPQPEDEKKKEEMKEGGERSMRFSTHSIRERKKSSRLKSKDLIRLSKISPQRKETNLAAKLQASDTKPETKGAGKVDKKITLSLPDKENKTTSDQSEKSDPQDGETTDDKVKDGKHTQKSEGKGKSKDGKKGESKKKEKSPKQKDKKSEKKDKSSEETAKSSDEKGKSSDEKANSSDEKAKSTDDKVESEAEDKPDESGDKDIKDDDGVKTDKPESKTDDKVNNKDKDKGKKNEDKGKKNEDRGKKDKDKGKKDKGKKKGGDKKVSEKKTKKSSATDDSKTDGETDVTDVEETEDEIKHTEMQQDAVKDKTIQDKDNKDQAKDKDKSEIRHRSVSIMKIGGDAASNQQRNDLNVSFKSKKYISPTILKALEVTDDLKRAKERMPTPHPSFTSLEQIELIQEKRLSIELSVKKDFASSIVKLKPCRSLQESEESFLKDDMPSNVEDEPKKQTDDEGNEVVLNVISPDLIEEVEEKDGEDSCISIGSDVEHLREFLQSKYSSKGYIPKIEEVEEAEYEPVPVPPLINKTLLSKRRMIKRPLANILRKVYGWVMTTVIRRRLLISYGLPPKIRKECFFKKKFEPNDLDLARGMAKLVLEESSEFYPFAVLEPYIETILEQTMDPTKRYNFTKRIIRLETPLDEEGLSSLQEFLTSTEEDYFFKRARVRRLRKLATCLKQRVNTIAAYDDYWAGSEFNQKEWLDIFKTPKLDDHPYICAKKTFRIKEKARVSLQQQREAFLSYNVDDGSPELESISTESSSTDDNTEEPTNKESAQPSGGSSKSDKSKSLTKKSSMRKFTWMRDNMVKQTDVYEEWKPGFLETEVSSKQKVLDIVINKKADVTPSITEINDEMRKDFAYHKAQRKWMEQEREFNFIKQLNMFSPILPPKVQDRKLMKFVQSSHYPYFGTFKTSQTYTERRNQSFKEIEKEKLKQKKTDSFSMQNNLN